MKKSNLTNEELKELKYFLVERIVDNMETKDLVAYVMDDLNDMYKKMSDTEFLNDAQNYWDDGFDDVVEEIKEYANSEFKKPSEERGHV